jgi:SAM-dependent methyltransferase
MAMTSTHDWDDYWDGTVLPKEMKRGRSRITDAILEVIATAMPTRDNPSVLELGGAPGAYLAYFAREQGCKVTIIDSSPHGCELARENFEMLELSCDVIEADLFDAKELHGKFDVVYSLGLIEHFEDYVALIDAHASFLRPDGILILGCPNYSGIFETPLKWLRPKMMKQNDRRIMNFRSWDRFETALDLQRVRRGYVGGFSLGAFRTTERRALPVRVMVRLVKPVLMASDSSLFRFMSRLNGRWSCYMMGVYRTKPLSNHQP